MRNCRTTLLHLLWHPAAVPPCVKLSACSMLYKCPKSQRLHSCRIMYLQDHVLFTLARHGLLCEIETYKQ